jgi:GST-like protein
MRKRQGELLSWLFFVSAELALIRPVLHFNVAAPKIEYAINRYNLKHRHWKILDDRLAGRYVLGDVYSIVDMSVWGWAPPLHISCAETWSRWPMQTARR